MISEMMLRKAIRALNGQLDDECLEPLMGQEDCEGDFAYFAQRVGRGLPPTVEQVNAVANVAAALFTLANSHFYNDDDCEREFKKLGFFR